MTTAITDQNSQVIHLELKYCERCGGLWLRAAGGRGIYCARCEAAVLSMAPSTRHKSKARVPGSEGSVPLPPDELIEVNSANTKRSAHPDASWKPVCGEDGAA